MEFKMSDIDQVIQVIQNLKEMPDVELHLNIGDVSLSVWKGNIGEGSRGLLNPSRDRSVCLPKQPEQDVVPAAATSVKAEAPIVPIVNAAPSGTSTVVAQGSDAVPEGLLPIKAPFTGLFYRRPSPTEPAFVDVGSEVNEDTTVCLVEVMKCFSSIAAGVKGRVESILVENGDLVEIGQIMFVIRPS